MKPTVGRIVHYTNLGDRDGKYPPEVQAALITKSVARVNKEQAEGAPYLDPLAEANYVVSLHIFYPTGQFDIADVAFTKEPAGSEGARGKWAWPAREAV